MTYSIIARDPNTGEFGVAVGTRYFAVARYVPWAEAGVGVVATQSFTETAYGPRGLELMRSGSSASEALAKLMSEDPQTAIRQVAMMDSQGRVANHTGSQCVYAAGHRVGLHCSAQANMMARESVPSAMVEAFESSAGDLAERLLAACEAAEREGGDVRGKQSAALIVVPAQPSARPWEDRVFDLRIDDHPQPIKELRRLLAYAQAHRRAEAATDRALAGDGEFALAEFEACCAAFPGEPEFAFRRGLALAATGRYPEAVQQLAELGAKHPNWIETLRRFAAAGVIPATPEQVEALLAQN
jgi:uncharacterized Ntn-hydrolase superfamily protein